MDRDETPDPREDRANALYWESDESVNAIADELDLSKSTLYGMIHPLAAGLACPRCGAEMEYPNRTARERGLVSCPACGLEEEDEGLEAASDEPRSVEVRVRRTVRGDGPAPSPATDRIVAGTALLAAAAGFVLGRLTKRS